MIKRLIFDIDGTLIEWKDEYWDTLKEVFDELKITYNKEFRNGIVTAIDTYENENEYYGKQKLLEHINEITKYNFDINFLNRVLTRWTRCVPNRDEKMINMLENLSKKYEMVVLTNWFKDIQESRLQNFGILKYFDNVFATETLKIKPNKESFITAIGNRNPNECIMIGDSLKKDVQGALHAGLNAIYINPKANKEETQEYAIINSIYELKDIL